LERRAGVDMAIYTSSLIITHLLGHFHHDEALKRHISELTTVTIEDRKHVTLSDRMV